MELRKAHKNESFLKRRNITLSSLPDEDALSPDYKSNELVSPQKPGTISPRLMVLLKVNVSSALGGLSFH